MKIDPDHKPIDPAPLGNREYEDGGWYHFERWAGVSWFNGHSEYKDDERYGTIRSDKKIKSRFPIVIVEKVNGNNHSTNCTCPDCK